MNPHDQRQMTICLAAESGPAAAIDTMVEAGRVMATGKIPDLGRAREALTAWGIAFTETEPIQRMFGSTPALAAQLPQGWEISRRGGGGHNELIDDRGATRLRWHIHGWDPISVSVDRRFFIHRAKDIDATEAVVQIHDGPVVIHSIPFQYPHARTNDPDHDGKAFWTSNKLSREESRENYAVADDADDLARAWLDEHRPHWRDSIESWKR